MDKRVTKKEKLTGIIIRLAEMGLEEDEIIYALNITRKEISSLNLCEEIAGILKDTLEAKERTVEGALYRRAVGFEYEEIVNASTSPSANNKLCNVKSSAKSKNGIVPAAAEKSTAKSTIKTVIPDVTACIFWLKNRNPDKWRDSKDSANVKKSLIEALEAYDEDTENK